MRPALDADKPRTGLVQGAPRECEIPGTGGEGRAEDELVEA
jgi:hypothetical protein